MVVRNPNAAGTSADFWYDLIPWPNARIKYPNSSNDAAIIRNREVRAIEIPRSSRRNWSKSYLKVRYINLGNMYVNAVIKNPIVNAIKAIVSLSKVGLRVFL